MAVRKMAPSTLRKLSPNEMSSADSTGTVWSVQDPNLLDSIAFSSTRST